MINYYRNIKNCSIMSKWSDQMKKMIIFMPKLSIGGMEKALLEFLKHSNLKNKYNVTLYLGYMDRIDYKKQIPSEVNLKLICKGKWNIFNKVLTWLRMNYEYFKLILSKPKYDVSICYSHHHKILSKLARHSSKNSIIFIHTDLLNSRKRKELTKLQKKIKFEKYSKIICVSEKVKKSSLKMYPNYKGKIVVANNFIDGRNILKRAEEKTTENLDLTKKTFINISRHVDSSKKITRIIKAASQLKKENYSFKVLLIGDGPDTTLYRKMIEANNLTDVIILLGRKENPYPYLAKSDALICSSAFEGYGLVLNEARVLGIPIITTDVADAVSIINEGYGILCSNDTKGVYFGMKKFLDEGFVIEKKFDYVDFNNKINKTLDKFINE